MFRSLLQPVLHFPFDDTRVDAVIVDTFLVTLEDVEKNIAEGEAGFHRWQAGCEPAGIADTIAELETWAAFRKESPSSSCSWGCESTAPYRLRLNVVQRQPQSQHL